MGDYNNVISVVEILDQLFHGFCVGLSSPKVEQATFETVADVYRVFVVKILDRFLRHKPEENGEEPSCCQMKVSVVKSPFFTILLLFSSHLSLFFVVNLRTSLDV